MQKITPCLWFDQQAEEAAHLYTSIFRNTKIGAINLYESEGAKVSGRPEGSVMMVAFRLCGQEFAALNGGPIFKFTPAISFYVDCETKEELQLLWDKLSDGGTVMMELAPYPFSEFYGWLSDKYGMSWQLNMTSKAQHITPCLMFVGTVAGRAEEAMKFYTSLFDGGKILATIHYEAGDGDREGTVKHGKFSLDGQEFIAMDSSFPHQFSFNEATSLVVHCETQEQIDTLWGKLSAQKEAEQCGWLKDTFGVSWQIIPTILPKLLGDKDPRKASRVMQAILQMKKIDIAGLKKAYEGA